MSIADFLPVLEERGDCKGCECRWHVDQDCDADITDVLLIPAGWGPWP